MKRRGSTDLDITTRHRHLMIIVSQLKSEGKQITENELQKRLETQTGIKISQSTISRDLCQINTKNTFVRDIAAIHYSRMNQQSIQTYEMIKTEALTDYQKKWTNNKKVIRKDPDGTTIETTQTEEISGAKATFLRIALEAEKAIQQTINGTACDVSVVLMGDEHKRLKSEYEILKTKLDKS